MSNSTLTTEQKAELMERFQDGLKKFSESFQKALISVQRASALFKEMRDNIENNSIPETMRERLDQKKTEVL